MSVAFISNSDCGRHDTGWGAPEHVGRIRGITHALRDDVELFQVLEHVEGRHATVDELALAHDPDHIAHLRAVAERGGGRLDADTVMSEGSWLAATAAAGCVLDGVDRAFASTPQRSFSAVRPPGHHALRDRAMGFCLFGNVAVAAHYARKKHGAQRVLIVDWDVHHGNGTQALVEADRGIHFVSMHQWPWYPGTGAAEDRGNDNVWNIPMPPGLPPADYVRARGGRRARDERIHAGSRAHLRRVRLAARRSAGRLHVGATALARHHAQARPAERRVVRGPDRQRARRGLCRRARRARRGRAPQRARRDLNPPLSPP
ncbi:MAG TPA: histone deacetylase [Gemmatimonadaceae bacterium]|nr:histone deacetylase [Gemmatimonadaceae bacterium]